MFGNVDPAVWAKILANAHAEKPARGKKVIVQYSRKHRNKIGVVFWHGPDKFNQRRYGSDISNLVSDIAGTFHYRVGIETEDGERFFIAAENVVVIE